MYLAYNYVICVIIFNFFGFDITGFGCIKFLFLSTGSAATKLKDCLKIPIFVGYFGKKKILDIFV